MCENPEVEVSRDHTRRRPRCGWGEAVRCRGARGSWGLLLCLALWLALLSQMHGGSISHISPPLTTTHPHRPRQSLLDLRNPSFCLTTRTAAGPVCYCRTPGIAPPKTLLICLCSCLLGRGCQDTHGFSVPPKSPASGGGRCAPGPTDPGPETGPAATHRGFFSPEWYPQGGLPGNLPNVQGLVTTPHIRGLLQTWVTG